MSQQLTKPIINLKHINIIRNQKISRTSNDERIEKYSMTNKQFIKRMQSSLGY